MTSSSDEETAIRGSEIGIAPGQLSSKRSLFVRHCSELQALETHTFLFLNRNNALPIRLLPLRDGIWPNGHCSLTVQRRKHGISSGFSPTQHCSHCYSSSFSRSKGTQGLQARRLAPILASRAATILSR